MKKKLAVVLSLMLVFAVVFCTACGGKTDGNGGTTAAPGNSASDAIAKIKVGTGGNTGTYYAFTTAACQILATDAYSFEVLSTGGSQANIEGIEDGDYQMAIVQNDVMNYAYEGSNGFNEKIQSFSAIGCVYPEVCQIIATKSSGIKTVADLKGKNVAVGDAGSGVYYNATQILAAAGIDIEKDINKTAASFGDSATQLKDGSIDAAFITAGTPTTAITELATSTDVVAVDLGDEIIAKLTAEHPFYAKYEMTSKDYDFVTEPVSTVAIMATFVVTNDMPEDQAYQITKDLWEKQSEIAAAHAKGKEMDTAIAVSAIGDVPLHPGAAKYYKEAGIIA